MKKWMVGLLVSLLTIGIVISGCGEQAKQDQLEILKIASRTPALNASGVDYGDSLSITFNFPIDAGNIDINDLFASYGSSHTAGTPDLSSATLAWSTENNKTLNKTLTISGIKGWSNLTGGAGPKVVEIKAAEGKINDIFKNEIRAGNVLWKFTLAADTIGLTDESFDLDGIVFHASAAGGNLHDRGYSITTDSSGRILVAGFSRNSSGNYDMVIWRYDENGSLDPSFTDGTYPGWVVHDSAAGGAGDDFGISITTDSSGRILVAGYSDKDPTVATNNDMVIWRYNPDGSPDTSFTDGIPGHDGWVVHDNAAGGSGNDFSYSITTDSSGGILVTGSSISSDDEDMVIWRYDENGSLDPSFTDGTYPGWVVHDNAAGGNLHDRGYSITTDSSGKILVTGYSYGANTDMAIWRYKTDGSLDPSFGTGGYVVHDNAAGGSGNDAGYSITTDSSGRILVAGSSDNDPTAATNNDMVIWRYK